MATQLFATPRTSAVPSEYGQGDSSTKEKTTDNEHQPHKRLTVTFSNISVTANEAGANYGDTFLSDIDPRPWFSRFSKSSKDLKVCQQTRKIQ